MRALNVALSSIVEQVYFATAVSTQANISGSERNSAIFETIESTFKSAVSIFTKDFLSFFQKSFILRINQEICERCGISSN